MVVFQRFCAVVVVKAKLCEKNVWHIFEIAKEIHLKQTKIRFFCQVTLGSIMGESIVSEYGSANSEAIVI